MSLQNVLLLIGLVMNFCAIVFAFGKGSQRLDDHDDEFDRVKKEHEKAITEVKEEREKSNVRIDEAHATLAAHNLRVDRLEQWKMGFTAAANLSGGEKIQA